MNSEKKHKRKFKDIPDLGDRGKYLIYIIDVISEWKEQLLDEYEPDNYLSRYPINIKKAGWGYCIARSKDFREKFGDNLEDSLEKYYFALRLELNEEDVLKECRERLR